MFHTGASHTLQCVCPFCSAHTDTNGPLTYAHKRISDSFLTFTPIRGVKAAHYCRPTRIPFFAVLRFLCFSDPFHLSLHLFHKPRHIDIVLQHIAECVVSAFPSVSPSTLRNDLILRLFSFCLLTFHSLFQSLTRSRGYLCCSETNMLNF